MTTESNGEREPRPIEDLIKLDSYQGMTDTEIGMVVEYTAKIAAKNAAFAAEQEAQRQAEAKMAEFYRAEAEAAGRRLDDMVANPPVFTVIGDSE